MPFGKDPLQAPRLDILLDVDRLEEADAVPDVASRLAMPWLLLETARPTGAETVSSSRSSDQVPDDAVPDADSATMTAWCRARSAGVPGRPARSR